MIAQYTLANTPALAANAMVEAAQKLQTRTRDYNLAGHTGDTIENAQKNELVCFLSLLNGGRVEADSGARENVIPGPGSNPQNPLDAAGLDAPWLSTIGNHDLNLSGNLPPILVQYANNPVRFGFIQQAFALFARLSTPALSVKALTV